MCVEDASVIHLRRKRLKKHQLNICDRWYLFRYERLNTVEIIKFINKTFPLLKNISEKNSSFFSLFAHVCIKTGGEKIWIFHINRAIFTVLQFRCKNKGFSGKLQKDAIRLHENSIKSAWEIFRTFLVLRTKFFKDFRSKIL